MNFEHLAERIMFGAIKNKSELDKHIEGKLKYRKNKSFVDVKEAIKKGLWDGAGKTEFEISCVALYLEKVFQSA